MHFKSVHRRQAVKLVVALTNLNAVSNESLSKRKSNEKEVGSCYIQILFNKSRKVQLVERSLPTSEIGDSNPVIGKFYLLSTVLKRLK